MMRLRYSLIGRIAAVVVVVVLVAFYVVRRLSAG
jgi:hypothetical protein